MVFYSLRTHSSACYTSGISDVIHLNTVANSDKYFGNARMVELLQIHNSVASNILSPRDVAAAVFLLSQEANITRQIDIHIDHFDIAKYLDSK